MLLACLLMAGCGAINDNAMFGWIRKSPERGGYSSKNERSKPLGNVSGELVSLLFDYYNASLSGMVGTKVRLTDGKVTFVLKPTMYSEKETIELNATPELRRALDSLVKESGMMEYNKWSVHVNGLPPTHDCHMSADFSTGEHLSFSFNGGNCPIGFSSVAEAFVRGLEEIRKEELGMRKD